MAACKDAAKALGKKVEGSGHEFASSRHQTSGCYGYIKTSNKQFIQFNKYVDYVFYGTDGSKEQTKSDLLPPRYRPPGFDCEYKGKDYAFSLVEWIFYLSKILSVKPSIFNVI